VRVAFVFCQTRVATATSSSTKSSRSSSTSDDISSVNCSPSCPFHSLSPLLPPKTRLRRSPLAQYRSHHYRRFARRQHHPLLHYRLIHRENIGHRFCHQRLLLPSILS